ncbi:MAG: hypothetical protein LBS62_14405 [Clostridiales bacterium]|nr:hypothetical protein [Clostridiales bacterium]
MTFDPIGHMMEIMEAQGISVLVLTPPYDNIILFDGGFRQGLYQNYDYAEIVRRLERDCAQPGLYLASDQFEIQYMILSLPAPAGGEGGGVKPHLLPRGLT